MSCAKTAEPIKMQFAVLSQVCPGTCITWSVDAPTGRDTFWAVWPINKLSGAYDFGGWVKA